MLDITQVDYSLLAPAATGIGKPEPRWAVLPPAVTCLPFTVVNPKPVVTWQVTNSCHLNWLSDSGRRHDGPELSTAEGMTLIRDLAAFHVPRLQFAGGEPLIRQDLLDFVAYAHEQGIQPTLLTNGTLLSKELATGLKRAGLHSVTILLEGLSREPDRRPGERYAPDAALEGYANCETAGLE